MEVLVRVEVWEGWERKVIKIIFFPLKLFFFLFCFVFCFLFL